MSTDNTGDKRSVSTDALETLGTIIDATQKRDAIHLAVEPVVAGERLHPGDHITIENGVASPTVVGAGLGIVDPFLPKPVERGQRFWFVMYPRQVRSLRHVWTHPAFPDEPIAGATPTTAANKEASEKWLRDFVDRSECPGYEAVLAAAVESQDDGELDEYLHFEGRGASGEIPPEFWVHVEIVTGKKMTNRPQHFSCSC